ncbi:MAG: sugar transferase [Bradymonadaceae bacterium]
MSLPNIQTNALEGSDAASAASSPRRFAPLLLLADVCGAFASFNLASLIRLGAPISLTSSPLYGTIFMIVFGLYLADTYQPADERMGLQTTARVLTANLLVAATTGFIIYFTGVWGAGKLYGRTVIAGGFVIFTVWAVFTRRVAAHWAQSQAEQTRWLLLAPPSEGADFKATLSELYPETEVVEVNWPARLEEADAFDLEQWKNRDWSGVLISHPEELPDRLVRDLMQMRLRGIPTYSLTNFSERFLQRVPPSKLEDDWFVFSPGFSLVHQRIILRIKRSIDVGVSAALLLALAPLMAIVAVLIKLDSEGPVFYRQTRTGVNGDKFELYKFRSMCEDAEADGAQWTEDDDPRVTRVGQWMRKTRIDELPQLWNVLKGDMSLIGPRPERPEFDSELSDRIPYYSLRYLVKPGISGWAQVMHRYGASEDDARTKLEYDLYYIKNYSLLLDLAIALKTLRVILFTKGR